jgi:hypothetical protein
MLFLVTYTLNPMRANAELAKELQKSPTWMHYIDSSWLIATNEDAIQLYSRLRPFFRDSDHLLIVEIKKQATYYGWLPEKAWEWLRDVSGKGWATS